MGKPKLWVWMGSDDDKLDVLRYVSATDRDILGQPVVVEREATLRARVAELEGSAEEVNRLASELAELKRERDAARRELEGVRGRLRWRRGAVPDIDDQYLVKRSPRYTMILPYSIAHGSNVLRDDEWCPLGDILAAIEPGGRAAPQNGAASSGASVAVSMDSSVRHPRRN